MGTHAGKEGKVKLSSNAVAEVREWKIEESNDVVDSTTLDNTSGWKTHKSTFKSWNGSITCYWSETDTNGQNALTVGASVTLNVYPEGDAGTAKYYSGTATVTGVSRKASFDSMVEAEFTFQGNGALTLSTV